MDGWIQKSVLNNLTCYIRLKQLKHNWMKTEHFSRSSYSKNKTKNFNIILFEGLHLPQCSTNAVEKVRMWNLIISVTGDGQGRSLTVLITQCEMILLIYRTVKQTLPGGSLVVLPVFLFWSRQQVSWQKHQLRMKASWSFLSAFSHCMLMSKWNIINYLWQVWDTVTNRGPVFLLQTYFASSLFSLP